MMLAVSCLLSDVEKKTSKIGLRLFHIVEAKIRSFLQHLLFLCCKEQKYIRIFWCGMLVSTVADSKKVLGWG